MHISCLRATHINCAPRNVIFFAATPMRRHGFSFGRHRTLRVQTVVNIENDSCEPHQLLLLLRRRNGARQALIRPLVQWFLRPEPRLNTARMRAYEPAIRQTRRRGFYRVAEAERDPRLSSRITVRYLCSRQAVRFASDYCANTFCIIRIASPLVSPICSFFLQRQTHKHNIL